MVKAPGGPVSQEHPFLSDEPVSRLLPRQEETEGGKEQTRCLSNVAYSCKLCSRGLVPLLVLVEPSWLICFLRLLHGDSRLV